MSNPESTNSESINKPQPKKRRSYKWLIWLILFCGLTWVLQSGGPIMVNGISLTVPVSETSQEPSPSSSTAPNSASSTDAETLAPAQN